MGPTSAPRYIIRQSTSLQRSYSSNLKIERSKRGNNRKGAKKKKKIQQNKKGKLEEKVKPLFFPLPLSDSKFFPQISRAFQLMETLAQQSDCATMGFATTELDMASSIQDSFDSMLCVSGPRLIQSGFMEQDCKGQIFFTSSSLISAVFGSNSSNGAAS